MLLKLITIFFYVQLHQYVTANPTVTTSGRLDFPKLVAQYGYTGESYFVNTEDGYRLRINRISASPSSPKAPGKPVVYLQHPLAGSSDYFVFWGHQNSIAYLLADAGYDVWLGNSRGNTYSRRHETVSPKKPAFWNFTIDDIATKDLPALIDFALENTGKTCLTYIGHSLGTTESYVFLAEKPEYNKKINFVVSLAPIAYWNPKNLGLFKPMFNIAVDGFRELLKAPHYNAEVLPYGPHVIKFAQDYCSRENHWLCLGILNRWLGKDADGFTTAEIRHLANYAPAGTSLKILQHYRQQMNTGKFQKFDYENAKINYQHYGQVQPPEYDLSKITSPVALIRVLNDFVATKAMVDKLAAKLSNVVTTEPVPSKDFAHVDFLFHKDGKTLIYNRIIELINQHQICPIIKS